MLTKPSNGNAVIESSGSAIPALLFPYFKIENYPLKTANPVIRKDTLLLQEKKYKY